MRAGEFPTQCKKSVIHTLMCSLESRELAVKSSINFCHTAHIRTTCNLPCKLKVNFILHGDTGRESGNPILNTHIKHFRLVVISEIWNRL